MFGSGMGVDEGVGSDVVSERKKGGQALQNKIKNEGQRRVQGVAFIIFRE